MKILNEQRGGWGRNGRLSEIGGPRAGGHCCGRGGHAPVRAFTLIELLMVIVIISIIAGLVIGMAGPAAAKRKAARVTADLQGLMGAIENYKAKLGYYPPDNGRVATFDPTQYSGVAGLLASPARTNMLFYELAGASNRSAPGQGAVYVMFDGSSNQVADISYYFNRGGILNAFEPQSFMTIKTGTYGEYGPATTQPQSYKVYGILVPVSLLGNNVNWWYYDCSSPNRHNRDSYDLWAVYGDDAAHLTTNGNWKVQ